MLRRSIMSNLRLLRVTPAAPEHSTHLHSGLTDRRVWPQYCAALAVLCGVAGLAGRALDSPWLSGFGRENQPVQPLAAVSYVAIAIAVLAAMRSRPVFLVFLLAVPTIVVASSAFQGSTGITLGIDTWLFPRQVTQGQVTQGQVTQGLHVGRPYTATVGTLALLIVATAAACRPGRAASKTVIALASIALGISTLALGIAILGTIGIDHDTERFLPSVPAALQAGFISVALLLWRGRWGWLDHLSLDPAQTKAMRRVFPFVILIPALTALVEISLEGIGVAPPMVIKMIAAAANIFVLAGLVIWSMSQISAEHEARSEITHAMDSAPIALTSLTGEIEHWSRGCEELYGWSAEEAIGRSKYDLLKTVDAKARVPLRRVDDMHDADRELVEHRRDGAIVHVLERVRRVEAAGRTPVYVHSMTDISERVATEAALHESEANLNLALVANDIGISYWEAASGELIWSSIAERRLALSEGEPHTFATWSKRVDPGDLTALLETIASARRLKAERYSFHYRLRVPDGGVRAIEGSARCIYDDDGRLVRTISVNLDVTDRHEREQALRAQEEQFRLVLKTVPSAMVIIDDHGIIKAFSASAERLFGYAAKEVIGHHVKLLAPSAIRAKPDGFIPRYFATREKHKADRPRVLLVQCQDGSLVPIELCLGEASAEPNHLFTGFCNDLSERYAADERLEDMRTELLRVSRLSAMSEMATGLAHELNQPLAASVYFLGAADLLLADAAALERSRAFVRMANDQVLKAGDIIRRMRDFITKDEVEAQVVDIADIIQNAIALTFVGGAQFNIRIRYELDPMVTTVLADRVQIQQVFANLLRNAVEELRKCPPDRREITIATAQLNDDMIEFRVADSGPGINPKILDRIFTPFVSTKGEKGMGVGLSICRRIIEAHRGTFSAANDPGGGAVFRFTLPRMDKDYREATG